MPSRLSRALAALILGLPAGCSNRSSSRSALTRFPIGIYDVGDPKFLGLLSASGFDSCTAHAKDAAGLRALAQEARQRGMRLIMAPNAIMDQPVSATRGWPVDAWYLQDEPEVNGVSPETLEALSAKTRRWDFHRPQAFVVGNGSGATQYGRIGDIFMLDWYPVPHLKLDSVADQIDAAYKSLPAGKPLWMVLQAFDWREDVQRDPRKPRAGRFLDHAEMRFMSWLAVVHGAKGLFFFRLEHPGGGTLLDQPELWQAVSRIAAELKSLKPVLEKGTQVQLSFSSDPGGVEAKAWHYRGRDYAVVLNRSGTEARNMPAELLKPDWKALFEERRDVKDSLERSGDAWRLRPYQVMILESGLRW